MNLIISDSLVNPPTEILPLRYITWVAKYDLRLNILLESEKEYQDIYYKYMVPRGLFDFFDEILHFEQEKGIRLDIQAKSAPTILLKGIFINNQIAVLDKISKLL